MLLYGFYSSCLVIRVRKRVCCCIFKLQTYFASTLKQNQINPLWMHEVVHFLHHTLFYGFSNESGTLLQFTMPLQRSVFRYQHICRRRRLLLCTNKWQHDSKWNSLILLHIYWYLCVYSFVFESILLTVDFYATMHQIHFFSCTVWSFACNGTFPFIERLHCTAVYIAQKLVSLVQSTSFSAAFTRDGFVCHCRSLDPVSSTSYRSYQFKLANCRKRNAIFPLFQKSFVLLW